MDNIIMEDSEHTSHVKCIKTNLYTSMCVFFFFHFFFLVTKDSMRSIDVIDNAPNVPNVKFWGHNLIQPSKTFLWVCEYVRVYAR